jgi:hypothetical protein
LLKVSVELATLNKQQQNGEKKDKAVNFLMRVSSN